MTGPDREEIDFPSSLNPLRGYDRQELDVKTPEHIDDKRSRLKREELELEAKLKQQAYDASFNRIKEVVFIIVWISVTAVVLYSCFNIVVNQNSSIDDKSGPLQLSVQ